ncbi:MAG: hypothetical protein WDN46_22415 [Methylocella sp.]
MAQQLVGGPAAIGDFDPQYWARPDGACNIEAIDRRLLCSDCVESFFQLTPSENPFPTPADVAQALRLF